MLCVADSGAARILLGSRNKLGQIICLPFPKINEKASRRIHVDGRLLSSFIFLITCLLLSAFCFLIPPIQLPVHRAQRPHLLSCMIR
jgi:hypothetical protein